MRERTITAADFIALLLSPNNDHLIKTLGVGGHLTCVRCISPRQFCMEVSQWMGDVSFIVTVTGDSP